MNVTWNMFDAAVKDLTAQIKPKVDLFGLDSVYGIPRGGLCLAVALSHSLGLPLVIRPKPNSLVVDEICDTGKTLRKYTSKGYITATIVNLYEAKVHPTFAWMNIPTPYVGPHRVWINFPWEVSQHGN